ncbi:MAG: PfkB family carbohydrate kinase, partial [Oscillospiraceae bacterium]
MAKKPRILVVGSLVMDLIVSTPRVPHSGETVIGTSYRTAPGGKGANQAVQAARLGAQVTMVGKVGSDAFGRELTETVKAAGIDVSHIGIDEKACSAIGNILLEVTPEGTQNRITV